MAANDARRKFYFTVCIFNGIGILLAIANVWEYPRKYTGAFILGNLVTAILTLRPLSSPHIPSNRSNSTPHGCRWLTRKEDRAGYQIGH